MMVRIRNGAMNEFYNDLIEVLESHQDELSAEEMIGGMSVVAQVLIQGVADEMADASEEEEGEE